VLTYWRFGELEEIREKLKDRIKLATRYRVHDEARTEGLFRERLEGAIKRGCDLFIINESTPVHVYNEWGFLTGILAELGDRVS
jgi:hypothetical protein